MGHPEFDNRTPFAFEALFLADEEGRPLVCPLVKATFAIGTGPDLVLAEEQVGVSFAGEPNGTPGECSYRQEPEVAFTKPATDVVLVGHACTTRPRATSVAVELSVGTLKQQALVTGDRHWSKGLLGPRASDPEPFERIPLVWERAFGGWDRSRDDEAKHTYDRRNPVGVGYRGKRAKLVEGAPLPNIEHPKKRLASYGGSAVPLGFGFTNPDWKPRCELAGTYDEAWQASRMPRLPKDFDRRFFNAAPEGLVADGYLAGDEDVTVLGASPEGRLAFRLPGLVRPECLVSPRRGPDRILVLDLDTAVIDTDARRVVLTWRAHAVVAGGPHDVRALRVTCANAPEAPLREPAPEPVGA
jgi:hypothetical protein